MTNKELYESALESINNLFSDDSVSIAITKENLKSLIEEIEAILDALDN